MNQDDRLGPYRLLRRLGEGGMGVVHLAVDPHGRQVALKVLRGEVAGDDVARRRLSREVETMRRVRSEHIAEVVDADVTGRRPYIVTRYVPGHPLDELVKQDGPMDLPALLKVAHGVASALAAVHSVGVIHRDLKPGNVLILDGRPVLIDFGIAQAVDATRLTQTGMFIGTPGYLAPEIIEGHEAGPEVDVHAWAGTLVFAATGQPPFGKGTLEMIFYNITAGKANVDAVPAPLQPVLRAALQRDPAKRPTAAELAARVERLLPGAGLSSGAARFPAPPRPGDAARPRGQGGPGPSTDALPATGPMFPAGEVPVTGSMLPTGPLPAERPGEGAPWPPTPASPPPGYVSLLADQQGDPWPTRRVTAEELRQAAAREAARDLPTGLLSPEDTPAGGPTGASPAGGPTGASPAGGPAHPAGPARSGSPLRPEAGGRFGAAPVEDGDIPTQRVRPQDLQEYRNQAPRPAQPYTPPVSPEQTPQVRPYSPPRPLPPSYPYSHPPRPHHQAGGHLQPGRWHSHGLQRSRIHGVAALFLLALVTAVAVLAPVIVAAVVIPAVILLRAADLAQPWLNAHHPERLVATDVFRVFGRPVELLKSAGITLALVPYALILGLPVTLLLTVLVSRMPSANALSWGTAVALWALCAGPGVEGPARQTRRTLASLLPSRGAAAGAAAALGVVALLAGFLAVGTVGARKVRWAPADVGTVVEKLQKLHDRAAR